MNNNRFEIICKNIHFCPFRAMFSFLLHVWKNQIRISCVNENEKLKQFKYLSLKNVACYDCLQIVRNPNKATVQLKMLNRSDNGIYPPISFGGSDDIFFYIRLLWP